MSQKKYADRELSLEELDRLAAGTPQRKTAPPPSKPIELLSCAS